MKPIVDYCHRVQGSDEDRVGVGDCANVASGIHGDDPVRACPAIGDVVQEIIDYFRRTRGNDKVTFLRGARIK